MSINYPDSFKNIDWVKEQVNSELNALKDSLKTEKIHFVQENWEYDINLVKDYLQIIQNKSFEELSKKNSSAWIMAVQVALDHLGYFEDLPNKKTIDWIFTMGWTTQKAVLNFQKQLDNPNLEKKWIPGPETIKSIVKELNTKTDLNLRQDKYNKINQLSDNAFAVQHPDKKRSLVDENWKEINDTKYEHIFEFSPEWVAFVRSDSKYWLINKEWKTIVEPKYTNSSFYFLEGLSAVGLNGKYWFIDQNWNEQINLKYEDALNFFEWLAAVRINGKYGFIDQNGKEIITPVYDNIPENYFKDWKVEVKQWKKSFVINKKWEKLSE